MRRTAIRLAWADWRFRIMLAGLWLFYRLCNVAGLGRNNSHVDISDELTPAVTRFADSPREDMHVYNFTSDDGRVFTVTIAQVCGLGEHDPTKQAHV